MPHQSHKDGGGGEMMQSVKKVVTGNHATSYGAKASRVEVIAAYPITPQTQIVELLSEMVASGELKAKFIKVESEHSAMAAVIGASATGARAYTATSSHGLLLMHEMLHWAANARLPIVMANVNRAVGTPWNVWADQNDSLSQRDTGWMQIYCENNQEVFDTTIQAFRIAEQVSLPLMLNLDAFILSHTSEPIEMWDQNEIDEFLPPFNPQWKLDIENPHSFGGLTTPDWYFELRYKIQKAHEKALSVMEKVDEEYFKRFGVRYGLVEEYRCEDADIILLVSGTIASTAKDAVDVMRQKGLKLGSVKVRVFRPFPKERVRSIAQKTQKLIVIDRNISFGSEGIFFSEIKSCLYGEEYRPPMYGFIAGLGGRDVLIKDIEGIVEYASTNPPQDIIWWGVKV
jgi:pyruvate/2-oxoacid:ferredoxin oxidoreductase alpha subunit